MSTSPGILKDEIFARPTGTTLSFAVGLFFSFRLFIMLLSVRVLGTDPQTGVELSLALNFLTLLLVAFCSWGEVRQTLASMLQQWSIRWVAVFLAFSGCSLLWSSTASLPAAIAYWAAMAADVAMVALLIRANAVEGVADPLMKGYVWGACCIALIAWIMPAQADLRLGDEELLGPNQIGYLCGFALLLAQHLIRRRQGNWSLAVVFLAVTLLRSLSKTTIAAFIAAEAYLLVRDRSTNRKTKILLVISAGVVVAPFWSLLDSYYDLYTTDGNQSENLTGRLGIWAFILEAALEQPWIGHGFHSVWKVIPPFGQFEARHAHNELLQQFYAYGVAGIAMMAAPYGSLLREIRNLTRGPLRTLVLGMLIFVLVRGLGDTEPFDLSLPLWAIVLLSAMVYGERTSTVATIARPELSDPELPPLLLPSTGRHS